MLQLIAHLVGDYLLQSQWMADNKTKCNKAAFWHAFTYTLPFLFLTLDVDRLFLIFFTHLIIDRFRLAVYVVWLKNFFFRPVKKPLDDLGRPAAWGPSEAAKDRLKEIEEEELAYSWQQCLKNCGYPSWVPPHLAVMLLIIADNTIHLICNYLILTQWH